MSQKVLENLALGRSWRKRIDNLELKFKEREEENTLNKKVKKVNKIEKRTFSWKWNSRYCSKTCTKRKNEKKEEMKEEYV